MADDEVRYAVTDAVIELRDEAKRELDIRIMPWNTVISHEMGPEMFERGAFADVDPRKVVLKAPDPEGGHRSVAIGRGLSLRDDDEGQIVTFRVSKTQAGDEALTLVSDEVVTGASAGFKELPGGYSMQSRGGQKVRVQQRVALDHVALTWRPAYKRAEVIAMRSEQPTPAEVIPVPEPTTQEPVEDRIAAALEAFAERSAYQSNEVNERVLARLTELEERSRATFSIPTGPIAERKAPKLHHWASWAVRTMMGANVSKQEIQERTLEDVIVTENPGLVPDAFLPNLLQRAVRRRPFLDSTTEVAAPDTGMTITIPIITQHTTVDVQATEKTDIDSTALKVGTGSFEAVSVFGGADVSIQMLRRAEPSFMDLLMSDLSAAYGAKADALAVAALFAAGTTPGTGNIDPENLTIGEAWANTIDAIGETPDTIWLSSDGVAAFIDAKDDGTNKPLYFNLNASFGVGNAPAGTVSALRPVYVPAFNGTSVDVMIGPRSGFVWAEDGEIQLSVDNPSKAGRDIALGGILFFIPRYPSAFTTYDLGS